MDKSNVELLVCTTCKKGRSLSEGLKNPGQILFDNLMAAEVPEGISIKSVGCLANCSYGCSIVYIGFPMVFHVLSPVLPWCYYGLVIAFLWFLIVALWLPICFLRVLLMVVLWSSYSFPKVFR